MKTTFKKSDLKPGMLVETADGSVLTVVNAIVSPMGEINLALVGQSPKSENSPYEYDVWFPVNNLDDDLKHTNNMGERDVDHGKDVIKVYALTYPAFAMDNSIAAREVLWSRSNDEKKWGEMSYDEKNEFCNCTSCGYCKYEKECDADCDAVLAYWDLLQDTREAIAGLNNENIRKLFLTLANIGVIPKKEGDYLLGKIDDISCEEIARLGTYKVLLNDKDDDDEKKADEDEFVRKFISLFQ